MRFGLNEMGFPGETRAESLAVAAEAGFDGVEFSLSPEGALGDRDALDDLAVLADEHGLATPTVLTPAFWEHPLSSTDPRTRERALDLGVDLLVAADRLGARTVLLVPGVVDEGTPYDAARSNALDGVRELAGVAADRGITIGVENVWNGLLYSPLEFRDFVDAAAEAGPVGAYFDVGNVLRFGYPEQWLRILGDRVAAVHVKDYDADVDTADGFTYPLQGDVPWDRVAAALGELDYDGWVTAEVPPYEHLPERMPAQLRGNVEAALER